MPAGTGNAGVPFIGSGTIYDTTPQVGASYIPSIVISTTSRLDIVEAETLAKSLLAQIAQVRDISHIITLVHDLAGQIAASNASGS